MGDAPLETTGVQKNASRKTIRDAKSAQNARCVEGSATRPHPQLIPRRLWLSTVRDFGRRPKPPGRKALPGAPGQL